MTSFFASILKGIYDVIGNYGISIILFTIIIRLALLPLTISQKKSLEKTKKLNPKMAELKKKYGNDKQTYNQKLAELYKEEKINPLAGCLPLLIQIPIIYVLFGIFRNAHKYLPTEALTQKFLWLPNMVDPDTLSNLIPGVDLLKSLPGLLPIIAALFTYLSVKRNSLQAQSSGNKGPNMGFMTIMFPGLILVFGASYSAGLILYWGVSNIIQYVQDILITKLMNKEQVR